MSTIRSEIVDGVGILTLDAPQRRNAFDLAMCDEVTETLDRIEADRAVGALIVTGAGTAFCAGADLSHLAGEHGRSTEDGLLAIYEGFLRVARSPLPTIAAVNGPAVGAGMNLALACDLRMMARSGRLDARFLQLGIHPGGGHTWMTNRIAGPQVTAATVLFGEVLDGEAAVASGLAWRCVEDEVLIEESLELARRAAAAPRELVERIKATIRETAAIDDHGTAMRRELADQAWSADLPEFRARLEAMRAKITGR